MQPCGELENIVLHHYGKFDSGTQADSVEEIYSLQEGVPSSGMIRTNGLMIAIRSWHL
jgi:hypothetical protein